MSLSFSLFHVTMGTMSNKQKKTKAYVKHDIDLAIK